MEEILMQNDLCLVCGSKLGPSKYKGLLQCKSCGFITSDLDISDNDLKKIYGEDYFHGKEYGNYLLDKPVIQKNFKKRLKTLLRYVSEPSTKSLFEIGCAYGFFLEIARNAFGKVFGIDISDDAINYAKNSLELNAISGDFLEYEMTQNYDIYCMWDTIEHLKKPDLFIQKISKHINMGGLLAITTGDISSINAIIRGEKWRQIHPPTHLHYFSRRSLSLLLENNGFKVVYIGYPGSFMSLNNVLYIIFVIKKSLPGIYKLLNKIGLTKLNIYLNMKDLIYIIAKKK